MARTSGKPNKVRLLSRPSRFVMWAGVAIGLAFFLLFGIVPAVANIVISLTDYSGWPGRPPRSPGWTTTRRCSPPSGPALSAAWATRCTSWSA